MRGRSSRHALSEGPRSTYTYEKACVWPVGSPGAPTYDEPSENAVGSTACSTGMCEMPGDVSVNLAIRELDSEERLHVLWDAHGCVDLAHR